MKKNILPVIASIAFLFYHCKANSQKPSVETFKEVFEAQMQKLLPQGFTKRTISFVQVTPGTANGAYYSFKVTAYVHDYGPGYPANRYYGQTCLGFMDGWKFDMRRDEFGDWIVQGRFTVSGSECKDNPSEGAEAIPLTGVKGTPYKKGAKTADATEKKTGNDETTKKNNASQLYLGEYACYGTGGRLMAGMGFTLLSNGKYYDLDKQRGGSYTYNAKAATITFKGGFLDGQVGKNVKQTGFQLSSTVYAEPWR